MSQRKLGKALSITRSKALLPLSTALLLTLTGCSASDSMPSATASASSAQASQEQNHNKAQAKESSAQDATDDSHTVEENFDGAEALKTAQTVSLDAAEVQQTKNLYNNFEDSLTSIELTAPQKSEDAPEEAPDAAGTTTSRGTLTDATIEKIKKVSTGNAADEFLAQTLEYGFNGWTQEGKSTVVGEPKLTDTTYKGQSAKLLEVCIDSSNVRVKDSAGNILNSSSTPKQSLNIFTLVNEDNVWKIANHDFPNDPTC